MTDPELARTNDSVIDMGEPAMPGSDRLPRDSGRPVERSPAQPHAPLNQTPNAPDEKVDTGDSSELLFSVYVEHATMHDKAMVEGWHGDMDSLLIFVSAAQYTSSHKSLSLKDAPYRPVYSLLP